MHAAITPELGGEKSMLLLYCASAQCSKVGIDLFIVHETC